MQHFRNKSIPLKDIFSNKIHTRFLFLFSHTYTHNDVSVCAKRRKIFQKKNRVTIRLAFNFGTLT